MDKQIINRIQKSIDYIEDHLLEKIEIEEVAKTTYMSQSSFYTIFSNVLGTTIKDYIRKRRLSLSAYDLIHSDWNIIDIAIKYQYCTYESYSRAFKRLFGVPPKTYRENNLYIHVFPRVSLTYYKLSGGIHMISKEMNKEIIIEKINALSKGYILDIDIDHFDQINKKYSYRIGDKVLIEVPKRVKEVLQNHDIDVDVIRINGDEFALIIKDQSKARIEAVSKDILKAMAPEFTVEDLTLKLSVSIGISDFTVGCDDEEVISNANEAMLIAKKNGKNQYKLLEQA